MIDPDDLADFIAAFFGYGDAPFAQAAPTLATDHGALSRPGIDNRLGYCGYVWDRWLQIYHVRHRVYEPYHGRWYQPDPIGFAGGRNWFEYCGGSPGMGRDSMGLDWEDSPGWNNGVRGTWHHYYREERFYFLGMVWTSIVTETLDTTKTSFTPAGDLQDNRSRDKRGREFATTVGRAAGELQQASTASVNVVLLLLPGPELLVAKGLGFLKGAANLAKEAGLWYKVGDDGVKILIKDAEEVAKIEAAAAKGELTAAKECGKAAGAAANPHLGGKTPMPGTRATGVARARQAEVDLVRRTGKGTRNWTKE